MVGNRRLHFDGNVVHDERLRLRYIDMGDAHFSRASRRRYDTYCSSNHHDGRETGGQDLDARLLGQMRGASDLTCGTLG